MEKKINLILALGLVLVMVMSAFGCASQPQATAAEPVVSVNPESEADDAIVAALESLDPNRGEGKTIGVVAFFQANDWNRNALQAIRDNLEPYNYTVNIIDGQGDAARMNAAIDTHIANNVDGIIIAGGDGTALISGSQKIVAAGIPYTVIDMFQEGAITNVMADNWGGGTQLGLWVVTQTGGKGKVLILDTPSWVTLLARADSADVVFNPFRSNDPTTGITTQRFDIDAGNAVTDAQTKVAAALAADTNRDIKAIVTTWNLPAVGAYAALKDAGRTNDIVIASGDTGKDVLQAMRESEAGAWVFMGQNSKVLGMRAAQGLDLALHGLESLVPYAQFGPTYFVSNLGGSDDPVIDGSEIKLQSPEQHWTEVFGTEFGTMGD
jgi:ribose transport system substrate-binding protein